MRYTLTLLKQQTLSKSFIAELSVVHPDLTLAPTIKDISGISIELESQPITTLDSPVLFYSVKGADFQDFESALADDHTIADWKVVMTLSDCRMYQVRLTRDVKVLAPELTDHQINVLAAKSTERGWRIRAHVPDKASLSDFWTYCREENIEFQLEKLYSTESKTRPSNSEGIKAALTPRQREVARTTIRMEYFDQTGASAEEVAAELGIASSTLSTHLRRIMANLLYYIFGDDE